MFLSLPHLKIYANIIAPNERRNVVENQLNRITFKQIFDKNKILSEVNAIYYSSLNLGIEIVESVYKRGGDYKIEKFLTHCKNEEWQDLIDES